MKKNDIIIMVLWIVMILYIPVFIFTKKEKQKNIYLFLTIIFILTTLANAAYSIYLTHTDQNISKNGEKELYGYWIASSIGSCFMIFFIIVIIKNGGLKTNNNIYSLAEVKNQLLIPSSANLKTQGGLKIYT